MNLRVLTTQQSQTKASGNAAHNAARVLCAAPLPFLVVFLFDLTRAGEIVESMGGWWAVAVPLLYMALNFLRAGMLWFEPILLRVRPVDEYPSLWKKWTTMVWILDYCSTSMGRKPSVALELFNHQQRTKGHPEMEWKPKEGGERGPN